MMMRLPAVLVHAQVAPETGVGRGQPHRAGMQPLRACQASKPVLKRLFRAAGRSKVAM
jgi:hypothetical protein